MRREYPCALLALALGLTAARASAHAPLPRAVAVSPSGDALALALPGFGLLLRPAGALPFVYACDALNGIPPSDSPALMQYFDDGTLLIGSPGGLRVLAANGCPRLDRDAMLGAAAVFALAIQPSSQVAYAIAAGDWDGVWRSIDRGVHWERRGSVGQSAHVTGLLVDPTDSRRLYVSRSSSGAAGSTLLVSDDSGASFVPYEQDRGITLLAVEVGSSRLWAVARALDSKANRGFDILRSDGTPPVWTAVLRVNFFGGLTITDSGEVWVGDEGRGVYRSTDSGDSFSNVAPASSVSCLASAGASVWAATPNLPAAPALHRLDAPTYALQPEVAFADVDRLVACAPEVEADARCDRAWIEWQRDVLMRDLTMEPSIPPPTAATPALDPAPEDAGTAVLASAPQSASCTTTPTRRGQGHAPVAWAMLACVSLARTLRRSRRQGSRATIV